MIKAINTDPTWFVVLVKKWSLIITTRPTKYLKRNINKV